MCLKLLLKNDTVNKLKDFETYAELEAWFDLHKELKMEFPNLCDDYSREARALAEADGYFLSTCLVAGGIAYQTIIFPDSQDASKADTTVYHIGNSAIVTESEEVYYVDLNWSKLIKLCNFFKGGKY